MEKKRGRAQKRWNMHDQQHLDYKWISKISSQTTACSLWKRIPTNENHDCGALYVQNLTEPIKRVLQQAGVEMAIKPVCVLSNTFCKPKDKIWTKKSLALFVNCLVVVAMRCTSVNQAEA